MKKLFFAIFILFSAGILFADVPNEIVYQGKLKEYGLPVNGTRTMLFEIYDDPTAGSQKWNSLPVSVPVSSGIFTYTMTPNVDWRGKDYWIQLTVNSKVLFPREKITSNVFAIHAKTAEDITKSNGSIDFSVGASTYMLLSSSGLDLETGRFYENGKYLIPPGVIVMWSGAITGNFGADGVGIDNMAGWALCDGQNGRPDLRDRFILSVSALEEPGAMGGSNSISLLASQLPSHSHTCSSDGAHSHTATAYQMGGGGGNTVHVASTGNTYSGSPAGYIRVDVDSNSNHQHTINDSGQTRGSSIDIRPAYYKLAFIMKL